MVLNAAPGAAGGTNRIIDRPSSTLEDVGVTARRHRHHDVVDLSQQVVEAEDSVCGMREVRLVVDAVRLLVGREPVDEGLVLASARAAISDGRVGHCGARRPGTTRRAARPS